MSIAQIVDLSRGVLSRWVSLTKQKTHDISFGSVQPNTVRRIRECLGAEGFFKLVEVE